MTKEQELGPNPKNREVKYEVCKYATGPWKDRWVVRRTVTEDFAAALSEEDARHIVLCAKQGG